MRFLKIHFIFMFLFSVLYTSSSASAYAGEMVIVANSSFPVESITPNVVKSIYLGKKRQEGSITIVPIDLPDDNKTKNDFVNKVLGFRSTTKYNSYWIGKMFKEGGVPPEIKDNINEALKIIASKPGAIGYCEKEQAQGVDGIKILLTIEE